MTQIDTRPPILGSVSGAASIYGLEARMNTIQADLSATLERFRTDMARRDAEAIKRDKENTRWQIGLWVAAIVVLGILVRWPG